MKRALALAVILPMATGLAAASLSAQQTPVPPAIEAQQDRLRIARAQSASALKRSQALEVQASRARDAATRASAERAAAEARIVAAQADIAAARARIAIIDRRIGMQRERLADRQGPMVRLIAAIQSLARRPEILGVVQPGSLRDAVHVRALLGSIGPVIDARSRSVRVEIDRSRNLRGQAGLAVASLRQGAQTLNDERMQLIETEARQRLRAGQLARGALVESDRAIALGEQARDLIANIDIAEDAAVTENRLAALAGPLPRPEGEGPAPIPAGAAPYRLPVAGVVATGFGELSENGVRARGISLAARANAPVAAPASGRVVFARTFRGYSRIVIIDHGDGWSTLVTGLASLDVEPGTPIAQGAPLGRAGGGDALPITVELRRHGQPVDLAALIG
ncbi:murein hydrolase activator EnvC family protein [Sphingomonas sp. AX6]|uniref:murein hydrolase activator EnvC family protein n=1 Tax=Sphingomonas sp. AX6 TaxID=2653171 RepID=UPI0012F12457|nr:peptidoglycan DD-metalloendopeptidase family protein [Sphingomonas sp. AX6]VXC53703.1 Septal ring factor EnvC (AmiA/AmiB activator) [Sphingomonas sp. AX6]